MPLYEYKCLYCEKTVARLRRIAKRDDPVRCPSCRSEMLRTYTVAQWQRGKRWQARMMDHDAGKPGRKS